MAGPLDPARIRALAEHLVALPSVSPDAAAERACAAAIVRELPAGVETGEWLTADGRPVVWVLLRGRSPRTLVLLGHYDTVGVDEFAALGAPAGERIAFDAPGLHRLLCGLDVAQTPGIAPDVLADLEHERREPGTWMFGRGALDMKSGLAAGLGAFAALAQERERLDGSVLFIACPDEEHESQGMLRAVRGLVELREREALDLVGVLNLDYGAEPAAYSGVAGKLLVQVWVLGDPTHVSEPFRGCDASQLAAEIVRRATLSHELVDRGGPAVPPVVLRLRDLKAGYNVQTAREAVVEFNLSTCMRPLAETMETMCSEVAQAIADLSRAMAELRTWTGRDAPGGPGVFNPGSQVWTYPELLVRAGWRQGEDPLDGVEVRDARQATLERLRRLARRVRLMGPAAVVVLLPPYYPHAAPGDGVLPRAMDRVSARRGIARRAHYPYITDASYVAWRGEPRSAVEQYLPALGREYDLPVDAARELDLDVVNLGPWGRGAHGLFERVHAPHAFGVLPGLIVETAREALAASHGEHDA